MQINTIYYRFYHGIVRCWFLAALCCAPAVPVCHAAENIEIDSRRDPRFLPYAFDVVNVLSINSGDHPLLRACCVIETGIDSARPGLMAVTNNTAFAKGEATQIGFRTAISPANIISDNPIWLVLSDQMAFRGPAPDSDGMFAVGLRKDSLFAVTVQPYAGRSEVLIVTGSDRTGDGVWSGAGRIVASGDFDYDGRLEVLVFVSAARDISPRILAMVQVHPLRVEWSFSCATVVEPNAMAAVGDSADAGFIVVGGAPGNALVDSYFSDSFCYLFGLSAGGKVRFRRVIGLYTDWVNFLRVPDSRRMYVIHTLPFLADTTEAAGVAKRDYALTEINEQGDPLNTAPLPGPCRGIWTADYDADGRQELYLLFLDGHVEILNPDLDLMAQSEPTDLLGRVGELHGWDTYPTVQVMQSVRGTEVYSNQFHKLAAFGEPSTSVGPVTTEEDGTLRTFFVTSREKTTLITARPVGLIDLASIIYVDYQPYILSILFGLVVGLVTVNHYRRRTRRNLTTIADQKRELEETHAALHQAQAQIIAQEKYRQARDIAGGFAHEIRNALFPARVSIAKARTKHEIDAVIASLRNIDRAVGRAIDITGLITTYTRAESEVHPEPVDLQQIVGQALKDNRMRIENEDVTVRVDARPTPEVRGNRGQLVLVIDNLIRNSLDALADIDSPEIVISVQCDEGGGKIRFEDNGPGVPDTDRERIFDMFYSTKPRTGTGVGLALSRKIVSLYDGTLTCESSQGGACFVLRLPLQEEPD